VTTARIRQTGATEAMCGRYKLSATGEEVAAAFGLVAGPSIRPRYNIAPTQPAPVVRLEDGERPVGRVLQWGLVPSWAKDPSIGHRMINARAETVAEKPAYRVAFRRRRCLVPADGFYEWRRDGKVRTPHLLRLRGGGLFAFAGLWEAWEGPDGALESFTILTTTPNALVAPIHDRMPVILAPGDRDRWLRDDRPDVLAGLLRPVGADAMEALAVSRAVNDPRFDDPSCAAPLDGGLFG
jgi:putative SOS response-associated peptidase YedK